MYNKQQFIKAALTIARAMRYPFGGSQYPLAEAIPVGPHQDYARIAALGVLEDLLYVNSDMRTGLQNLSAKEREDCVERFSNIIRVANNVSRTAMMITVQDGYYVIDPAYVAIYEQSANIAASLDDEEFAERFGYSKKILGTPEIGGFVVDPGLIQYKQSEIDSFVPKKTP